MSPETSTPSHSELLAAHAAALDLFGRRVHDILDDQWDHPTPCTDWNVRDLVAHLVSEQLWAPPLLAGETMESVGDALDGDLLGEDPVGAWEAAARGAREAFAAPGALDRTVELSYGPSDADHYCGQMTTDLIIHAWDLARGIGATEHLPAELVAFADRETAPYADDLSGSGVFAPPLTPPSGADPPTRLLARLGREA